MKKFMTFIAAGLLVSSIASAQTAEEVIDRYLKSNGGKKNFDAIKTITMEGVFSMPAMGFEATMEIKKKRPTKYYSNTESEMGNFVQAYDGETAWWTNPMMGITKPTKIDPAMAKQVKSQAQFHPPFVNYKQDGHKVAYVSSEKIGEKPADKIKLTTKDGEETFFYFDKGNHQVVKMMTSRSMGGQTVSVEVSFSDFKKVEGMFFPSVMNISSGMQEMQMNFDTIEVNAEISDDIFVMPKS